MSEQGLRSQRPRLIDQLDLPGGLKGLDSASLRQVAAEVREEIITTVSRTGGHLGSSLGVVELTVALHAELDAPRDAIIWDVGHQAYAHKLLTGRLDRFHTLRQFGGLSGFPRRSESIYDAYGTGHSSTSISAAIGMAEARRRSWLVETEQGRETGMTLRREGGSRRDSPGRVVAVIGDGALTGGMAYEALNHAGHLGTPVLVILNDNAMSIERNVGALSNYLSILRTDPKLSRFRRDVERRLQRLPGVGERVAAVGEQLKDSIKAALVPGMLFEELGFTYMGVVDGHDIDELRDNIRRALLVEGPVLLHARTVKGKGYAPAEQQPGRYHGIAPFSVSTGKCRDPEGPTTFTEAFGAALVELARHDERIMAITAAMATGTGLDRFRQAFPERFFDVGIAEGHAVGLAAGLAAAGKKPVVAVYSTFLQRAYDQIVEDVCLQNLPVVFAVDRAGLVGEDGPTHHGAFDLSFLRVIPGLTVFVPKDEAELQRLLATALSMSGPAVIRYPRSAGVGVPLEHSLEQLQGPWLEELRCGSDLLLLGLGPGVQLALEAADLLAKQELEASVVNVRRVKPLDVEALTALARRHEAIITIEDNVLAGGFGSAVLEALADQQICLPVRRIGLPDAFVEHGAVEILREQVGLTANSVAAAGVNLLTSLHTVAR